MTTVASTVGPLTLPIPAGAANSPIADPLIDGLLEYLAFWIKWALDAKLANLQGPDTVAVSDACPEANRFGFNPAGWWVRVMTETRQPALFVWHQRSSRTKQTMVYDMRERQIGVMYAFPEFLGPRAYPTRSGLIQAVDAVIRKAFERGAHPGYQNDMQFVDTIADPGTLEVILDNAEEGFEFVGPQIGAGAGGQPDGGFEQYGFPTLRGTIIARERILGDSLEDPDDILNGISVGLYHNEQGDVGNGVLIKAGTLLPSDGSEDGDEVV